MPIASLQRRLTQVGVIRLGEKRTARNGNSYPAALDSFRITSPSKALVEAVAAQYGGTVKPWQSPSGPEFEVVTKATEMQVFVPPQVIDPNFELWGNGYKSRQCDGVTEKLRGAACLCEQAARLRYERRNREWPEDGRFERAKDDCKPTTRMAVMLADIPSMGTLKLESHGWNAAAELPGLASAIARSTTPVPALLRLEARSDKRLTFGADGEKIESRNYVVPVLDFFGLFTPEQAFGGALDAAVQQAIGGTKRQAIAAPPTDATPARDWAAEIAAADSAVRLNNLREDIQKAGIRDRGLFELWQARGAEIAGAAEEYPAPVSPAAQPTTPVEVVEAEPEPDRDETWTAILREASKRGWNLPVVEGKYRQRMGHDSTDEVQATGWKYAEFLTALQGGEVK